MNKLNDNDLLGVWNESINKVNNSKNDYLKNKFLNLTSYVEIKKANIINTRNIDDDKYISFIEKNIDDSIIYSFVIFNLSEDLPPEKSRIEKYCLFTCQYLDIIDNIIQYKTNEIINVLNLAIDTKFESLFNQHFKTIKYKLDKKNLIDILVKPNEPHIVPSISNIIEELPHTKNIPLYKKETEEDKIKHIFKNTCIIKDNNVFNNEKSSIIKRSTLNEIITKIEEQNIHFPKEKINIMD